MSKRVCTIENIIQFVPAICFKSHQAKCNLKRVVFIQYLKPPFGTLKIRRDIRGSKPFLPQIGLSELGYNTMMEFSLILIKSSH